MKNKSVVLNFAALILVAFVVIACGGGGGDGGGAEADITPPSVTLTDPASDTSGIQISSSIQVTFDEALKPSTANTGTVLMQTGGTSINYSISCVGNQIVLTPDQTLEYETIYTVTLTTGIEDLSGNPMTSDYVFSFTTMSAPLPSMVFIVIPADQEQDVLTDSTIEVVFTEEMNPSTISQSTFYVTENGNSVGGLLSYGSNRLTFTPTNYFAFGATVSATMTTGIQNLTGTGLSNDYTWDFKTRILHGSPVLIESNVTDTLPPEVAVDPDGNVMVIWGQWYGSDTCGSKYDLWANYYNIITGWDTPQRIENIAGTTGWYDIGNDDNGNFIVAWYNMDSCGSRVSRIWASRYVKGVGWGTAEAIDPSPVDDSEPNIAVNSSGNAVVVWHQNDSKLWANIYSVGSGWASADTIAPIAFGNPQAVIDSSDNVTVTWSTYVPGCTPYPGCIRDVWAVRYLPSSGWGTPEVIDSSSEDAGGSRMGVDGNGKVIAAWGQGGDVWYNRFEQGIGWGTAEIIGLANNIGDVAVDQAGNAIAGWYKSYGTSEFTRYEPGSGWGTVQTLYSGYGNAGPRIVLDANGNGYVTWYQTDADFYNIWAKKFTVSSGWSDKMLIGIADLLPTTSYPYPRVGLDSSGDALVVWRGGDGVTSNIWANHIP